jgi:hypothetical protein
VVTWNTVVDGGLPVNGLHALVHVLGATKLPLAEDSPKNKNNAQTGDNSNDGCQSGTLCADATRLRRHLAGCCGRSRRRGRQRGEQGPCRCARGILCLGSVNRNGRDGGLLGSSSRHSG